MAKEPDDVKTTITYDLFGDGGSGLLLGEHWFHYRHGILVRDRYECLIKLTGFTIKPVRLATEQDIEYLDSIIGEKWTIRTNCKTRLERLCRIKI